MARTYGRIKTEVWDSGSDYRRLPTAAQWVYQMLVSQPNITQAGVLAYAPRKWARLSCDMTTEIIKQLVDVLEQAGYVILDAETEELLVRSFVKHDEPWRLRNNLTSARTQFRAVESASIRAYLSERHPWIEDAEIEPEKVQEYERDYVRSHDRSNVRSNDSPDDRSNGVLLAGEASHYPEPNPSKGREVQGSTPRATPRQETALRAEDAPAMIECPLCGPVPKKGTDLVEHLSNVHGVEDPERLIASRLEVA